MKDCAVVMAIDHVLFEVLGRFGCLIEIQFNFDGAVIGFEDDHGLPLSELSMR
jgi:hypothetical protein